MKHLRSLVIHLGLFLITLLATTFAGAEWMRGRPFFYTTAPLGWAEFWEGFQYSIPFLGILTVHEFGHYLTAQYYHLRVTLPYYIPLWFGFIPFFAGAPTIGTMGAFIRIKSFIESRKVYFDVGIAGPLAGFVIALGVLWYGFAHLPPPEHIFEIHPEYQQYGLDYARHVYDEESMRGGIKLGTNLLFEFFKHYVADPERLPNDFELMHYPYLLAGYLALFFTALNLIPIGQLDGGHVLYGLIGYKKHRIVAKILFFLFLGYAGLGLFTVQNLFEQPMNLLFYLGYLYLVWQPNTESPLEAMVLTAGLLVGQLVFHLLLPQIEGYAAWLVFGFLLGRVVKVAHPKATQDKPLDTGRKILGVVALLIFVLCFTPRPLLILE